MIKAMILYFLSIKPTHGYEIQKYIQLNELDDWTRIQSGSIYYALSKLYKDSFIDLYDEQEVDSRIRKVYCITDKGKLELKELLLKEFNKPIYHVGSDKFLVYPFINEINKQKLMSTVEKHLDDLQKKLRKLEYWQARKINERSLTVEKLSFEMMVSNVNYQIQWHEALIDEIDQCIKLSHRAAELIKTVDFSEVDLSYLTDSIQSKDIKALKEQIFSTPEQAEEILKKYIDKIKHGESNFTS